MPKGGFKHLKCHGLLGTYDDGLAWLQKAENQRVPKTILSLGSSIGNFTRTQAAEFLKGFSETLGKQDTMLIGLDACQDKDKVYHAYNDQEGKTHEFVRNGLTHANKLIGEEIFQQGDWEVIGEYDESAGRHQAFFSAAKNLVIEGVHIEAGERVRIEESYKYSPLQRGQLWQAAGLVPKAVFGNDVNDYRKSIIHATIFLQEDLLSTVRLEMLVDVSKQHSLRTGFLFLSPT